MSVNLTYGVTYNTSKRPTTRTKETNFGDGYTQVTVDGINYDEEKWDVDFVATNSTNTTSLENILLNSVNGTSNYLLWTGPGETVAKYYTAGSISKIFMGPDCWKMSCEFTRQYPLV